MSQAVHKYWQLAIYLLSLAVGVGITLASIRNSEARLGRIEALGTPTAQEAARKADELDRRVTRLEGSDNATQKLLERIDERTLYIVDRLDRFEKQRP